MSNAFRRTARAVIGATMVAGSVVISAGAVGAATPATRGCVGSTLSAAAADAHSQGIPLGLIIRDFAQDPNTAHVGLGDDIQVLQAGFVPDEIVPNTCN
jgi:hypothetical protein